MSVCSTCFDSGITVDGCAGNIVFGYVTPETEYTATVTHNATNRVQTFTATSDIDGLLTISGAKIDNGQGYTIRLLSCDNFTICENEYACITFAVINSDVEAGGTINLLECIECGG
jgi:hypothetical protein